MDIDVQMIAVAVFALACSFGLGIVFGALIKAGGDDHDGY